MKRREVAKVVLQMVAICVAVPAAMLAVDTLLNFW
jgi:hypothetical protein